jgi:hypothetical protein
MPEIVARDVAERDTSNWRAGQVVGRLFEASRLDLEEALVESESLTGEVRARAKEHRHGRQPRTRRRRTDPLGGFLARRREARSRSRGARCREEREHIGAMSKRPARVGCHLHEATRLEVE